MIIDLYTKKRQKMLCDLSEGKVNKRRLEMARTTELLTLLDEDDWKEIKSTTDL
jgi:hypothetical protein